MALPPRDADDASDVEKIAELIGDYLRDHPNASDTVEGAARWWLADPYRTRTDSVRRAFERLEEAGTVKKRRLPDGTVLYGRTP